MPSKININFVSMEMPEFQKVADYYSETVEEMWATIDEIACYSEYVMSNF